MSACFSTSPKPGLDKSGVRKPFFASIAPSKAIFSMRTWSKKYSTLIARCAPQQACAWMEGAV